MEVLTFCLRVFSCTVISYCFTCVVSQRLGQKQSWLHPTHEWQIIRPAFQISDLTRRHKLSLPQMLTRLICNTEYNIMKYYAYLLIRLNHHTVRRLLEEFLGQLLHQASGINIQYFVAFPTFISNIIIFYAS